jgi:hypothetical protein
MTFIKKIRYKYILVLTTILFLFFLNKYFPYLRTDLFRSIAKGNWNMVSQNDTLYAVGYFGINKYLITNPKELLLLSENSDFIKNRIFGRDVCIYGTYLYVTARSFLPGSKKTEKNNGQLLVLNKSDLSLAKMLDCDTKLVESKTINNLLLVSSLEGFYIYSIENPSFPKLIFSYKHENYREYQGFDFFESNDNIYVAFSLFGEGLEIWNITNPAKSSLVCTIPINETKKLNDSLYGLQSMDLIVNYPYIYATLGPAKEAYGKFNDKRGLIVYDIKNLRNIKKETVFIPKIDWYSRTTGDKQPTYISKYKHNLYVNFAEKGVARFDISDASKPEYKGVIDVSGENALIQPVHITERGHLFTGSYYWESIYGIDLNEL